MGVERRKILFLHVAKPAHAVSETELLDGLKKLRCVPTQIARQIEPIVGKAGRESRKGGEGAH